MRRSRCGVGLLAVWIGIVLVPVGAQESQPGEKSARTQEGPRPAPRQELEELRLELYELRGAQHQNQRRMESIESRLRALGGGEPIRIDPASDQEDRKPGDEALDAALEELGRADEDAPPPPVSSTPGLWSRPVGPVRLRLIDVSFDVLFAAGGSTERDESLGNLQGGEHDPRKRGFTLQNAELSLVGAVDPYLYAEAHVIYFIDPIEGESEFELEEAFATTQFLPYGFQAELGQFFTEFGLVNPEHPHQWDFLDQPVVNTRFFGPDGIRAPGVRLGWLAPLPFFSEFHAGVQNANGESMASFYSNSELFEERPIGGRPFVDQDVRSLSDLVYLLRWENAWDLGEEWTLQVGGSGLYGPNATGSGGRTVIWGADVKAKWQPARNRRGWPFVIVQSEIMGRDYRADEFFDPGDPADPGDDIFLPRDTLEDWGVYSYVLYGFHPGWAAGLRYEYASGSGASVGGRENDPFRDDRTRISPLISWLPTEYSRYRLQYNYDHAPHLTDGSTHSVWFGVEFLFGAHPAHAY